MITSLYTEYKYIHSTRDCTGIHQSRTCLVKKLRNNFSYSTACTHTHTHTHTHAIRQAGCSALPYYIGLVNN